MGEEMHIWPKGSHMNEGENAGRTKTKLRYAAIIIGGLMFCLVSSFLLSALTGGMKNATWWQETADNVGFEFHKSNRTLTGRLYDLNIVVDKKSYGSLEERVKYLRIGVDVQLPCKFYHHYAPVLVGFINKSLRDNFTTGDKLFDQQVGLKGKCDPSFIQQVFISQNRKLILDFITKPPSRDFENTGDRFYGLLNQRNVTTETLSQAIRHTAELAKHLNQTHTATQAAN